MGVWMALQAASLQWEVVVLLVSTTALLQVTANLANEWGDWLKGTDVCQQGRAALGLQSGRLSERAIKGALVGSFCASLCSGLALLWVTFDTLWSGPALVFLAVGALAAGAALCYTLGARPYGYRALGDAAVFLFFGIVAVGGSYYLLVRQWQWPVLFNACAAGCLITGVLNVNNIRDLDNDNQHGKVTLALWLCRRFSGRKQTDGLCATAAKVYQTILVAAAPMLSLGYVWCTRHRQVFFLLALPLLTVHVIKVWKGSGAALDNAFVWLVAGTLLFALLSF